MTLAGQLGMFFFFFFFNMFETLVSGNMDQNLRNPSCLILSYTHFVSMLRAGCGELQ